MKKNDLIMYGAIAAGVYGLYWYITSYGPQGPVKDANGNLIPGTISYWNSWFGSSAAAALPAPAPTTTTAVTTTTAPSTTAAPSQTTAPGQGQPISTYTAPTNPSVPATPVEIAYIQSLLQPSDLPAFQAMIPTLTSGQALAIIAKAQACPTQARVPDGSCASVAPNVIDAQGAAPTMTVRNRLAIAAGTTSGMTVSQWNWYYDRLGIPGSTPGASLGDNGQPMDIDTYLSLRASKGMGMITDVPMAPQNQGLGSSPWGKLPKATGRRYLN